MPPYRADRNQIPYATANLDNKPPAGYTPDMAANQVPRNFEQAANFPWHSKLNDNKIPLPPSGWWPNTDPTSRFPPKFDSYPTNLMEDVGFNMKPEQSPPMAPIGFDYAKQDVPVWNPGMVNPNMPFMPMLNAGQPNPIQPNQGLTARQKLLKENKKMFSKMHKDSLRNDMEPMSPPGYSLFNSNWAPNISNTSTLNTTPAVADPSPVILGQQSLFSGPGPSPLERLLEQQKQQRDPPMPKGK